MALTAHQKIAFRGGIPDEKVANSLLDLFDDVLLLKAAQPYNVTIAAAAGGANVCEVTFTVKDCDGTTIAAVVPLIVYLSDAATGVGLTGTSASGTVQAKSASGTDLGALTAKKALIVMTNADGTYVLEITDTAKTGFYPCGVPLGHDVVVGTQLVTGDYGS